MYQKMTFAVVLFAIAASSTSTQYTDAAEVNAVVKTALASNNYSQARKDLKAYLAEHPEDDAAHFAMGIVTFGHTMQSAPLEEAKKSSLLRTRTPQQRDADYQHARQLVDTLASGFKLAAESFEKVDDPAMKAPLTPDRHFFEVDGDKIFLLNSLGAFVYPTKKNVTVHADLADAVWLRAQCLMLLGGCQFLNAHDWRRMLDYQNFGGNGWIDLVVALHCVKWPVLNRELLLTSRTNLENSVKLQVQLLTLVSAETDNDREMITSPSQTAVLTGNHYKQSDWTRRQAFFEEILAQLKGERQAPNFGRPTTNRGKFNLRRAVFEESDEFDLIGILHGASVKKFEETEKPVSNQLILFMSMHLAPL